QHTYIHTHIHTHSHTHTHTHTHTHRHTHTVRKVIISKFPHRKRPLVTSVSYSDCISDRDGYRFVFIRNRYITDTFKTIPVPKRCRNRYFYKKNKKLRLTTFKKGFF